MSSKSRVQEDQKMLEEFLKLKPTRAIDRLLNEHSLDKVYVLYNTLQQKIRKNTSQLRSTLTDKYQNLVDCSNLLTTIQTFTHQIQNIAHDLNKTFHQNSQPDSDSHKDSKNRPIKFIQQCIHRKKYTQAMILAQPHVQRPLSQNELLYLPFLKAQILQALEHQLITKKITQVFITEVTSCLQAYLHSITLQERQELVSNTFEEGGLMALIAEQLKVKQDEWIATETDILEIIFKCKLFSLHRFERQTKQQDKISKFFHDIYQLISEEDRHNSGTKQLAHIFCLNLAQIQAHLSETFIVSSPSKIISFRYDLYQQLLSSQDFIRILQQLHSIIVRNYDNAPKVSLRQNFINLWNNYYRELLQLLFQKCNPISQLPNPIQASADAIPNQLAKYMVSDLSSVQSHLKSYRSELELFFTNINQLLSKAQDLSIKAISEDNVLTDIINIYSSQVQALNLKVNDICEQLAENSSQFNLRSTIILFFLCDQFNSFVQQAVKKFQPLSKVTYFRLNWNDKVIKQYYSVFTKTSNWNIKFDHFFMSYISFTTSNKVNIIKKIVLLLLEGMMQAQEPAHAQSFLQQCRKRKEKQEKEALDKRNKLRDLTPSSIGPKTFSKKREAQNN